MSNLQKLSGLIHKLNETLSIISYDIFVSGDGAKEFLNIYKARRKNSNRMNKNFLYIVKKFTVDEVSNYITLKLEKIKLDEKEEDPIKVKRVFIYLLSKNLLNTLLADIAQDDRDFEKDVILNVELRNNNYEYVYFTSEIIRDLYQITTSQIINRSIEDAKFRLKQMPKSVLAN